MPDDMLGLCGMSRNATTAAAHVSADLRSQLPQFLDASAGHARVMG